MKLFWLFFLPHRYKYFHAGPSPIKIDPIIWELVVIFKQNVQPERYAFVFCECVENTAIFKMWTMYVYMAFVSSVKSTSFYPQLYWILLERIPSLFRDGDNVDVLVHLTCIVQSSAFVRWKCRHNFDLIPCLFFHTPHYYSCCFRYDEFSHFMCLW